MIKLERIRESKGFSKRLHGNGSITLRLQLLDAQRRIQAGMLERHEFNQEIWKDGKSRLKKESSSKCAYCEARTSVVAHGDVEHFRPKSHYWWLAYCYDNYLYSCQICNQTFKGDNFPIHGKRLDLDPPFPNPFPESLTAKKLSAMAALLAPDPIDDAIGYPRARFLEAAALEKAGIVDPYIVDPEPLFKWKADDVLKEVSIQPRKNTVASRRAYKAVTEFLGLNREELRRVRWETYNMARFLDRVLKSGALDAELAAEARAGLKRMTDSASPFAGMVRYFVTNVWKSQLEEG